MFSYLLCYVFFIFILPFLLSLLLFFSPFFLFFYYTSCTLFPTNKPLHPQCRRLIILEYEGELYRVEVEVLTPFCACAQPTAFHACVNYFNLVVSVCAVCFPYNLFYFCVNHCVCTSYCEVNQINKHKHRFVVVNNTFEIVAIRSVCERKAPSGQPDVKSTRRRTEMSASINMVNFNHQTLFSGKPLP